MFVGSDALVGETSTCIVHRVARTGGSTPVGRVGGGVTKLMSLALSPTYAQDGMVFAYVSTASDNRVVSMTYDGSSLGTPRVVLAGIPLGAQHQGGALAFAPDGLLHVGVGDQEQPELAQDLTSLAGKTLRIRRDGTVPAGNPFGTAVWTYGHRNVEGMAFSDGVLYATEFGESTTDELNLLVGGANYGWPDVEGGDGPGPVQDPLATWTPTSSCSPSGVGITGGYAYVGALAGRALFQVDLGPTTPGQTVRHLYDVYGRIRTVAVAPDGALWLTTGNNGGTYPRVADDDRVVRLLPGTATTAPTDVRGTVVSASSASLTWAPPVDYGASALTGYRVERDGGTAGGSGGSGWSTTVAATSRSQTFTNLAAGSTYTLMVSAVNAQGVGPAAVVAVTMSAGGVPGPATSVVGRATSSVTATLSWAPPATSGTSAVTGYRVARDGGSAGGAGWSTTVSAGTRSQSFTNLVPGSTYSLTVSALNAQGAGPATTVTVPLPAATVPGAPVIGTATAGAVGGAVTATAAWSPPASTGGSPVTGYRVRALRMSSNGSVLGTTTSGLQAATARSLAMTLPQTGSYRFTVEAVNAAGVGPQSARSNQVAGR